MKFKIVVDSCCDLTDEMKSWDDFSVVPLTLEIGDYKIMDDENFDQDDFIGRMIAYNGVARSACPAPDAFKEAYKGDYDAVFVLTITDQLSGTYNSAVQGKMLYEEEYGNDKKIYVFNSLATSGLETLVAKELRDYAGDSDDFDDIVRHTEDYILNHTSLYFCLESMDALKQNGRLFAIAANVLKLLKVKLICKRTKQGNISVVAKDIAINRALMKAEDAVINELNEYGNPSSEIIISHVCCRERADTIAQRLEKKYNFDKITVLKCSGLNSLYASNGGIIISFSY